ncbi:2Fe-2S iron-sulfur cluster-binding protein [Rhizorhapis suberifaciens]|uniref:2Fe-2S ferredoxin n=1 Tax=Rhizorhapis suberifaciens TaxID=13656 RepID=A0A840HQF6_9SPHN|nr:2Fe-2S iron-sulfur cluster-binding protein [Rhizorhapis suberifaciens]MBB4640165.1 2Fe-2S ferredoxin [Rhizorhapis suberifaciens]
MPQVKFRYPNGEVRTVDASAGNSVMRAAVENGLAGIEAECGGALTCATCHVHVEDGWTDRLAPPDFAESELLQMVEEFRPNSRLSCQIMIDLPLDGIVIGIPQSNL